MLKLIVTTLGKPAQKGDRDAQEREREPGKVKMSEGSGIDPKPHTRINEKITKFQ